MSWLLRVLRRLWLEIVAEALRTVEDKRTRVEDDEYDEVERKCRGCMGPCGRCHEARTEKR
jgi:hypothetical protein